MPSAPATYPLFAGRLTLRNTPPRPTEDPLWLAAALPLLAPPSRILDAGCGNGILALAVNLCQPGHTFTLIDNNPASIALAQQNLALNHLSATLQTADFLTFTSAKPWDVILSNPPFHLTTRGHTSPSASLRQRHQAPPALLEKWLTRALAHTTPTGKIGLVLHTANLPLLQPLCVPYHVQIVPLASHATRAPKRCLLWLDKAQPPAWHLLPPLPVHQAALQQKVLHQAQPLNCFSASGRAGNADLQPGLVSI